MPDSRHLIATNRSGVVERPAFQLVSSPGFVEWLAATPMSLALTTYHVGGVLMLGHQPDGDIALHVAAFDRSMGTWTNGQTLWLVTERMLWRFENSLASGMIEDGYDRVFVPRVGYTTGALDGHEVAVCGDGRPVFVNTRFNCLATVDERFSFRPLWQPPFISQLVPEDRCHLSGLAVGVRTGSAIPVGQESSQSEKLAAENSRPLYVTLHARSDVADGWRNFRETGGLVMDVDTNDVVADGLSMPHSPRLHGGRLWLLNSGTGHLGFVDPASRKFEPVSFIPGYARGLAFHGDWAVVGLSKPRREYAFQGLPLEKNLAAAGVAPCCGLQVIDLKAGSVLHWVRIESAIEELFDVALLPGVRRPKALSFTTSTYAHQLSFVQRGKLQRWTIVPEPQLQNILAESGDPIRATSDSSRNSSELPDMMGPRRTPKNLAKALNNLGLKHIEQGRPDEARQCFEKAVQHDPAHVGAHNNLGNLLREADRLEEAVVSYRHALDADPNYKRGYFNLGQTLVLMGHPAEAVSCFRRALRIDPHYVDAGVALGMALTEQRKLDEAESCFRQAMKLDGRHWSAHNGLGLVHKERDELSQALACYEAALKIEPRAAAALSNKGSVLRELGQVDEALACYERALEIDPQCAAAHHNRSMLRLLVGDYERGWPEYEWRWKQPLRRPPFSGTPAWDGSALEGRTILVHDEQGKGDAIQFARYAMLVKRRGGRVVLSVDRSLVPLFRSVPGVDELVSKNEPAPPHDVQVALMSLPACFGTTLSTIPADVPYLRPRTDLITRWKEELHNTAGLKVGIAWQGNPEYPGDKHRSFRLDCFATVAALRDVTLFSLQKGYGREQLQGVDFPVVDLAARLDEKTGAFEDTAAVMTQLDLVITCNTAIAHLAGALAVPVWVALDYAVDWRFLLQGETTPWYPTMRLFRQEVRGVWGSVFAGIAQKMAALIQGG